MHTTQVVQPKAAILSPSKVTKNIVPSPGWDASPSKVTPNPPAFLGKRE